MSVFIAVGIAVLGVVLIIVGIVALRDDAPRWTLKIKRPGWLLTVGFAAVVFAYLLNASRFDIAEEVTEYVGQQVSCEKVGAMEVEGDRRDVHACAAEATGARLGCFVRVDDIVVDVSRRAESEGTGERRPPDC